MGNCQKFSAFCVPYEEEFILLFVFLGMKYRGTLWLRWLDLVPFAIPYEEEFILLFVFLGMKYRGTLWLRWLTDWLVGLIWWFSGANICKMWAYLHLSMHLLFFWTVDPGLIFNAFSVLWGTSDLTCKVISHVTSSQPYPWWSIECCVWLYVSKLVIFRKLCAILA